MLHYVTQTQMGAKHRMSTSLPPPSALPRIRILVCGDSGVGKSSLVNRICGLDSALSNSYITPNWLTDSAAHNSTSVCMTSQVYHYDSGKSYFCLEFLDFNGSRYFEPAREVLLSNLQGIIFVFDVSNRNSYENLQEWIQLVCQTQKQRSVMTPPDIESLQASRFFRSSELVMSWFSYVSHSIRRLFGAALPESPSSQSGQSSVTQLSALPVLTVGNKTDVLSDYENASLPINFDSVSDFGIPGIFSCCQVSLDEVSDINQFKPFLNKCIQHSEFGDHSRVASAGSQSGSSSSFVMEGNFIRKNADDSAHTAARPRSTMVPVVNVNIVDKHVSPAATPFAAHGVVHAWPTAAVELPRTIHESASDQSGVLDAADPTNSQRHYRSDLYVLPGESEIL